MTPLRHCESRPSQLGRIRSPLLLLRHPPNDVHVHVYPSPLAMGVLHCRFCCTPSVPSHLRSLVEDTVQAFNDSTCQIRYRSLNGRNLERLTARSLPDNIRARRLLNWQQIRQNREVRWPLLTQLGQVTQRAALKMLLCLVHLRWQATRREVQL